VTLTLTLTLTLTFDLESYFVFVQYYSCGMIHFCASLKHPVKLYTVKNIQ